MTLLATFRQTPADRLAKAGLGALLVDLFAHSNKELSAAALNLAVGVARHDAQVSSVIAFLRWWCVFVFVLLFCCLRVVGIALLFVRSACAFSTALCLICPRD